VRTMPEPDTLPELEERTLLAIWKLKGVGRNGVDESSLQTELTGEAAESVAGAVQSLVAKGFILKTNFGEPRFLSLTPLGLAILRKLEEDRLQELK
jgi:DNA-binding MarR family transcriptional regulator